MAAKISWHRYVTKLRHCRPMCANGTLFIIIIITDHFSGRCSAVGWLCVWLVCLLVRHGKIARFTPSPPQKIIRFASISGQNWAGYVCSYSLPYSDAPVMIPPYIMFTHPLNVIFNINFILLKFGHVFCNPPNFVKVLTITFWFILLRTDVRKIAVRRECWSENKVK